MKETSGYGSHTWDGFFSHLLDKQEAKVKVAKVIKFKKVSVPNPEQQELEKEEVTEEKAQKGPFDWWQRRRGPV